MADDTDPFNLRTMASAPAAAGAAAPEKPDSTQEKLGAIYDREQRLIDRAERSAEREPQIYEDKARALAPVRQRMMDLAAQPLPEPPQMEKPPAAPKRNQPGDDETWLMASALLGSLAGAFTRRHQTNALAAFAGAIEGYQQGSREKFDQNMKIWEAENKATLERNQQAMDHYRQILENRRLTEEQMSVALQMAAAQYDDQAMATAARTKNSMVIAQLYDKQAEALQRVQTSSANLQFKYDQMQQRERMELLKQQMRAVGANSPEQMQETIDAIGSYRSAPITGRQGTAIMQEVYRQYPEYDMKKWLDERYRATVQARVEAASQTSAARMEANRVASLDLILRSVKPSIQMAAEASSAVPTSTFKRMNEFMQMAADEIGDPAVKTLNMANLEVVNGWAKAMNGATGQLTVAYQREAMERLSTATSREAYISQLKFLDRWLDQELRTAQEAKEHKPPMQIQWPDSHSTTIQQMPGAIQKKEDELRERSGLTGDRLFDQGEFQPRALIPEWLRTPEWLRNKIYVPPSQRGEPHSELEPPLPGWKVEQVG